MRYGNIKRRDVADGVGVRVTLFVSGCTHHCPGCFQPETWNFDFGQDYTGETEREILDDLSPAFVTGLTLLGGEPFEPDNQRALLPLLRKVREQYPAKDVWAYSGYTFEELTGKAPSRCRCEVTDEMLSLIDVLVDGEFVEARKDVRLIFRGSDNQRLIDVPKTLGSGEIVWWKE